MVEMLSDPAIWASLLTLTALEIVLGIDNIIFLSIISNKLPPHQRDFARKFGLSLALLGRIGFLFSLTWIIGLEAPIGNIGDMQISWRDVILFAGGLFLLYKGTLEIHAMLEGHDDEQATAARSRQNVSFMTAITQIAILDVVFALDSMITAVGLSEHLWIMITANVIAMIVMVLSAAPVAQFIAKHPTVKMLALAFLLLVGVALVADGLHFHIPRNYIYFAIAFSITTETLNILVGERAKRRRKALEEEKSDSIPSPTSDKVS